MCYHQDYMWAQSHYYLIDKKGNKSFKEKHKCMSDFLRNFIDIKDEYTHIEFVDFTCKKTKDYTEWYLNLIAEALALEDVIIKENSFTFRLLDCKYKNLLVITLIRYLYEQFANKYEFDTVKCFFKPLKKAEKEYSDKLEAFTIIYKKISIHSNYFHDGHTFNPKNTNVKYTSDFINSKNLKSVNSFFYE